MSIGTKRIISSLLNAKDGVLRPSYMAVMYAYDLLGKGGEVNSHDINYTLESRIELTRVSISRLCKTGYLEWIDKNLYKPTDKWFKLREEIERLAKTL